MKYLEDWIGSMRNYYYYSENNNEITTQIRLYQSYYDWIGTKQTLVCNKLWLKNLTQHLALLRDNLSKTGHCAPSHCCEKLDRVIHICQNITQFKFVKCDSLDYVFDDDLYVPKNRSTDDRRAGFLDHLVINFRTDQSCNTPAAAMEGVVSSLQNIFTAENLERIRIAKIMFGYAPPYLKTQKADMDKIGNCITALSKACQNGGVCT